jgi:hypothetical protein
VTDANRSLRAVRPGVNPHWSPPDVIPNRREAVPTDVIPKRREAAVRNLLFPPQPNPRHHPKSPQ